MSRLRHLVLFRFAPGAGADAIAGVEADFAALAGSLPMVRHFEWGTNESPEGLDQGHTHAFVLHFDDAAARDAYLVHPRHQAFVERLKPLLAGALVHDFQPRPTTMDPTRQALLADIERLQAQARRLQLPRLDGAMAWTIGAQLREAALARGAAVTIELRIGAELAFFHAMPGTAAANADWARRKRNTAELLGSSSYLVGRELQRDGRTLGTLMGLPERDYAAHGGAVPLQVGGTRLGCVTVSGLPQRDDHALVVQVLAPLCGVAVEDVALDGG